MSFTNRTAPAALFVQILHILSWLVLQIDMKKNLSFRHLVGDNFSVTHYSEQGTQITTTPDLTVCIFALFHDDLIVLFAFYSNIYIFIFRCHFCGLKVLVGLLWWEEFANHSFRDLILRLKWCLLFRLYAKCNKFDLQDCVRLKFKKWVNT